MSSIFMIYRSMVVVLGCIFFGQGEMKPSLRLIEPKHVQEARLIHSARKVFEPYIAVKGYPTFLADVWVALPEAPTKAVNGVSLRIRPNDYLYRLFFPEVISECNSMIGMIVLRANPPRTINRFYDGWTTTDIFNLEENMPRLVVPRGPFKFFSADRPDYKKRFLFQINKVVRRFQSGASEPEGDSQPYNTKYTDNDLPPSVLSRLFRSIRRAPLGAKVGLVAVPWLVAWLLFFEGLDELASGRSERAAIRLLGAFLIVGITMWLIRPL